MAFERDSFETGVESQDSAVLGNLSIGPFARLEAQQEGLGPFAILERGVENERYNVQRKRAAGLNVFDPLATEQQITSEYIETPSVLSIRRGQRVLAATDNFILGSWNEQDQERMSFVFTFGEPTVFGGMGRRPRIFSYSGFLKDSLLGGKGISTWRKMYEKYLRGSKCRTVGAIADLKFRDLWRVGLIIASTMTYEESRPAVAPFSFSMFIIRSEP